MTDEPEEKPNKALTILSEGVKNEDADYEQAKLEIMDIISTSKDSLMELRDVANQSQHPRAYEVLANMINTLVSANKTIIDMKLANEKAKYVALKAMGTPGDNAKVVEGTIVASTKDIQDMIKKGEIE